MFNRHTLGAAITDINFESSFGSSADTSPYTFSSQAIGEPHGDRMVVVVGEMVYSGAFTATKPTVTIGGVAATVVGAEALIRCSFVAYRKVSSGTTANIVVTDSTGNTPQQCYGAVYSLKTKEAGRHDLGTDISSGFTAKTPFSAAVDVEPNGAVVYAFLCQNIPSASATFGGPDSPVTDINLGTESHKRVFGHVENTETATRTLTISLGSAQLGALTVVSFIP